MLMITLGSFRAVFMGKIHMEYTKITSGLVAALALTGCYNATAKDFSRVSLPPHIEKTARQQVIYSLSDPDSAQFRNFRGYSFSGPTGGYVVCGEVNAKNRLGGYAGFQPFRTSVGSSQSSGNVYINDLTAIAMPC